MAVRIRFRRRRRHRQSPHADPGRNRRRRDGGLLRRGRGEGAGGGHDIRRQSIRPPRRHVRRRRPGRRVHLPAALRPPGAGTCRHRARPPHLRREAGGHVAAQGAPHRRRHRRQKAGQRGGLPLALYGHHRSRRRMSRRRAGGLRSRRLDGGHARGFLVAGPGPKRRSDGGADHPHLRPRPLSARRGHRCSRHGAQRPDAGGGKLRRARRIHHQSALSERRRGQHHLRLHALRRRAHRPGPLPAQSGGAPRPRFPHRRPPGWPRGGRARQRSDPRRGLRLPRSGAVRRCGGGPLRLRGGRPHPGADPGGDPLRLGGAASFRCRIKPRRRSGRNRANPLQPWPKGCRARRRPRRPRR